MRTEFKSRPALHYKVKMYVGETKRRLETRLMEHKDACTVSYSAIANVGERPPNQLGRNEFSGPIAPFSSS